MHVLTPAALGERNALLTLLSARKSSPHHIATESSCVHTESKLKIAGVFSYICKPSKLGNIEEAGFNFFFFF